MGWFWGMFLLLVLEIWLGNIFSKQYHKFHLFLHFTNNFFQSITVTKCEGEIGCQDTISESHRPKPPLLGLLDPSWAGMIKVFMLTWKNGNVFLVLLCRCPGERHFRCFARKEWWTGSHVQTAHPNALSKISGSSSTGLNLTCGMVVERQICCTKNTIQLAMYMSFQSWLLNRLYTAGSSSSLKRAAGSWYILSCHQKMTYVPSKLQTACEFDWREKLGTTITIYIQQIYPLNWCWNSPFSRGQMNALLSLGLPLRKCFSGSKNLKQRNPKFVWESFMRTYSCLCTCIFHDTYDAKSHDIHNWRWRYLSLNLLFTSIWFIFFTHFDTHLITLSVFRMLKESEIRSCLFKCCPSETAKTSPTSCPSSSFHTSPC